MNATVFYPRNVNFTGRNGYFNQSGIDILTVSRDVVMLTPITGLGKLGRCDIEIPYESLPSVIGELKEAFLQITKERKERKLKLK